MFALTVRNLWSHKRRLVSTMLAITLGVSFLTGTLVLGDTMRATFADLFTRSTAGTDAVVSAPSFDLDIATEQALLDESTVDTIRGVDGVARAEGVIQGYGKLVGKDGKLVGSFGPPTVAGNWVDDAGLNPYRLAEGRLPQAADEVVINRGAAIQGQLHVGDTTTLQTPAPVPVKIVGLSTFGDQDSSSGVTFTAFTFEGAQTNVLHQPGKVSKVVVAAQPGVSQDELVARLRPALGLPAATAAAPIGPDGQPKAKDGGFGQVQVKTGAQVAAEQTQAMNEDWLDFFTTFLTVFAGIALLVASFSIYNTFTILVAQRSRDAALLRALGATRRQVLASTIGESLAVGVVASVLGIAGGLGISILLRGLFSALGQSLPASGLELKPATIVIGLVTGTTITLLSALLPARRASRVAPIEALRDSQIDTTRTGGIRLAIGAVLGVVGIGGTIAGVTGSSPGLAALGAVVTLAGVVVLGPVFAGPAIAVLGAPLRLAGVTGSLASENARRNPRRTSATAAALLVGVTVVTLFTVFASSLTASVTESVQKAFGGDLVVSGGVGAGAAFSPQLAKDIGAKPEVAAAVGFGQGVARFADDTHVVGVADPKLLVQVLDIGVTSGSLEGMTPTQLAVSKTFADAHHWTVGTEVPMAFLDGTKPTFTVGAIFTGSDVVGDLAMSRDAWTPHATQDLDVVVLAKLKDGVSLEDGRHAVEAATTGYAGTQVQDRQQYLDAVAAGIQRILGMVYVLLALAVIIALMGISNTLALSVLERRRELGLLRAVGETRRQVRSMIRRESVLIAGFGTVGGLGLGVFFGWALVRAIASQDLGVFAAAPGQLVVVLVVGALAGVLAAVRPARKAARLDVLTAIAGD